MVKKGKNAHILVIRLSAMGDVAMLVPCLLALVKAYPLVRITLLTRERFKPIFKEVPNVTIFSADVKGAHKGFFGLYRLYKQLIQLDVDAVADTHHVLRSSILKLFFRGGGYPFVRLDKGRSEKKRLTRAKNKVFEPLKSSHQRYSDVFAELGYPLTLDESNLLPKMELPDQLAIPKNKILIGIAPFAAHKSKMYPLDRIKQVIQELSRDEDHIVVLFGGGPTEVQALEQLESEYSDGVINVAGKLSFKEELVLISNLNVMLGMDSGNGHLAANYGVPVVTLWGVTHPYAGFAPYGQPIENSLCADREKYPLVPTSIYGNKYPVGYEHAMDTIAPETIVTRIKTILKTV
ncbi:glycosyltransferase family 9 protein [uncultured Croceitalea sp.]|uniref:glycosyltransferase family 9 protein n=1 Tax=uncultured Croceitalea sp. TaxID=1798908 RepID=UPI0033059947